MHNLDPKTVALFAWLAEREEIQQLIDEDDRAHVVVQTADGALRLRVGVPASRAECPTRRTAEGHRLCSHYQCKFFLHLTNDDGRPWHGHRWTLNPFWLRTPTPPTCSLDLAEQARANHQRGMSTAEVSDAIGCHTTLTRRRLKESLCKLKARGVNVAEWQQIIDDEEQRATEESP